MNNKHKVYFKLNDGGTESLWAEEVALNTYKLMNTPFYVYGLSYLDMFRAKLSEDNLLYFEALQEKSKHSTYRIRLMDGISQNDKIFLEVWSELEKIGCSYENANGTLFAIDVPKSTDIYSTYRFLELGEEKEIWDFEEGDCGHLNH